MVAHAKDFIVIEAGKSGINYWKDLRRYRELFYFLAWRDILVRYKQTVIGIAWSVIRPVLAMIVFTVIFGKIAKLPSGDIPYPVLVFVALLPWQFFANAVQEGGNSLIVNASMVSKIYFPRMLIPSSSIIVALVDFLISSIILVVIMAWYKFVPSWRIIFVPAFLFLAILVAFGVILLLSALNVRYRDFKIVLPFIVQFGLFISPVGFSSDVIPEKWRFIYSINPMVGVIDGFRWAIIGKNVNFYMPGFILSIVLTFALLTIGILYFRKTERTFADRI